MLAAISHLSDDATSVLVTTTAPSAQVAIPLWLEMVAIVVASASGVLTARGRRLDFVGAVGLAVVCGLGGGLLRDMILQVGNVYILRQPLALPISVAAATIIFVFPVVVERQERLIGVLDIMAVGIYAVMGADKAMVYGFNPAVCVMMGFFTAVGGGMLRDICLGQIPTVFRRGNFYAIAAIAGAGAYIALVRAGGLNNIVALGAGTAVTMGLRWISLRYNIMSPTEIDLARVMSRTRRRERERSAATGGPQASAQGVEALLDRRRRVRRAIAERRGQERAGDIRRPPAR